MKRAKNPIYLSTGTFTGRINGRDPHLLTRLAGKFCCDGFEWMLMSDFMDCIPALAAEYRAAGVVIPILHGRKSLGDALSDPEGEAEAREIFLRDCEAARAVDARRVVVHPWGVPDSDACMERTLERLGVLCELGAREGVEPVFENCVCREGSPLAHLEEIARRIPNASLLVDTRASEFHRELPATMESGLWQTNVRHVHINDYRGGYKDWDARYPIYQPGEGQIDWRLFFDGLRAQGYGGSITLEAPAMLPDGADCETLSRGLDFIRNGLGGNE